MKRGAAMKRENDTETECCYGIGIDSGGTFTDGVMMDLRTGEILKKTKVRTTHHKLLIGIRNCLKALPAPKDKIATVSLSTTLATNSVVEGKGADVGVFLIGQKNMGAIPADYCFYIDGGHDSQGNELMALDLEAAEKYIDEVKDHISAFAISATMSVRNPQHELELKKFIINKCGLPVICGHELTSVLGAYERAVTATLNAKLIPVITELITAVKQTMAEAEIDAPLMLVRGDGSLMIAENALDRPIETMLSGPAASIIGARYLTSLHDAIVADMGGTTTDTAIIKNGLPQVNPNGALVGGFLTRVKAVNIHTVGLGGDSQVQIELKDGLKIGPQRIIPLCVAAEEYPNILDELGFLIHYNHKSIRCQPSEFLMITRKGQNDGEIIPKAIHDMLLEGPHHIQFMGQELSLNPDFLAIDTWKQDGLVQIIGLTPTDFKVWRGEADLGVAKASKLAVDLTCQIFSLDPKALYRDVMDALNRMIGSVLLEESMGDRKHFAECRDFLVDEIFDLQRDHYDFSVKLKLPVIAVGAPVKAYYPEVLKHFGSELVIPENSEVANAVGAITGQVIEQVEVLIRPDAKGYTLYTPWEKIAYPQDDLDALKQMAVELARDYVLQQAKENGGHDIEVFSEIQDVRVNTVMSSEERFYLEGRVHARAIGNACKMYLNH